jgi:hypothetical protein
VTGVRWLEHIEIHSRRSISCRGRRTVAR